MNSEGVAATAATGSWQTTVQPVVDGLVRAGVVPGMIIAVARGDGAPEHLVVGDDGAGRPLAADTLVPVASITKLATALAALRLVADGALTLDAPLAKHLPDAASAQDGVTVRTLFCHTSGLPEDLAPGAAPYNRDLDWPVLARATLATPLARTSGTRVVYSNLGPGLLAVIVERLTGQRFNDAVAEHVLAPLGIEGYLGVEPPRPPAHVSGPYGEHLGTALEPFNSPFWRALALPWGGMLTTAAGALALARAFAGSPAGYLPPDLLAEATTDQTGGLAGEMAGLFDWPLCPWGLGAELHGDKTPHWAPDAASAQSFGHAGISGCLAWHDPQAGVTWSMLAPEVLVSWWQRMPEVGAAILAAME